MLEAAERNMAATDNNVDVAIEKAILKTKTVTGITSLKAEQYSTLKAFIGGGEVFSQRRLGKVLFIS